MILDSLDKRITFLEATTVTGEYGPEEGAFLPIRHGSRLHASVQGILPSKTEAVRQGLRINGQPTRIRIRFRYDIIPTMRVVVHGRTDKIYEIISGPVELGRKEGLEMVCVEYSS